MNPTIGKVYVFKYAMLKRDIEFNDRIMAKLSDKESEKLITELKESAKEIKNCFRERKDELKEYFKLLKKLDKEKEKRHLNSKYARKSQKEIDLETTIEEMKKVYFKKYKPSKREKARAIFIRNYDPDCILEIQNDEPGVKAVYAGKTITPTGKIVHKWYNLTPTKVPVSLINDKYVEVL